MEDIQNRVEELAKQGVLSDKKISGVVKSNQSGLGPQFASQLAFLTLELGSTENQPIIVKIQPKGTLERTLQNSDTQFVNELTMYTKILPLLHVEQIDITPKFIYGVATAGENPDNDIIILEDLRREGFVSPEEVFLDFNHVALTLRKLGEFHGLSYRAKKTAMCELNKLKAVLKPKSFAPDFNLMFTTVFERGFTPVISSTSSSTPKDVLIKMKNTSAAGLWSGLQSPVEPFAVIVHGDFNKNNVMYKYNENKQPESVRFFDFQISSYSDPTTDIAFFLYMNTCQELRDSKWDELLATYWEGVTSVEPDPGFTFRQFLQNFSRKALYGYLPCSFFLPVMLKTDSIPLEEFLAWDFDQRLQNILTAAGEIGTRAVADIVQDLFDRGYLKAYLDNGV